LDSAGTGGQAVQFPVCPSPSTVGDEPSDERANFQKQDFWQKGEALSSPSCRCFSKVSETARIGSVDAVGWLDIDVDIRGIDVQDSSTISMLGGKNHVESLDRDFLFAFRSLKKDCPFAIVAIFTLALGIGSTTLIFSVIDCVVLHPYGAFPQAIPGPSAW
jgi:hypothetical protein